MNACPLWRDTTHNGTQSPIIIPIWRDNVDIWAIFNSYQWNTLLIHEAIVINEIFQNCDNDLFRIHCAQSHHFQLMPSSFRLIFSSYLDRQTTCIKWPICLVQSELLWTDVTVHVMCKWLPPAMLAISLIRHFHRCPHTHVRRPMLVLLVTDQLSKGG